MKKLLKDPLLRRFVSASCFAGAFVWVAVRYFHVETEVVWVLFIMSFVFVGGMMVAGLVLAPLVRLFRPEPTLLGKLGEKEPPDGIRDAGQPQAADVSPRGSPHRQGDE